MYQYEIEAQQATQDTIDRVTRHVAPYLMRLKEAHDSESRLQERLDRLHRNAPIAPTSGAYAEWQRQVNDTQWNLGCAQRAIESCQMSIAVITEACCWFHDCDLDGLRTRYPDLFAITEGGE